MKLQPVSWGLLALTAFSLSGCRVVGDIFKAGVWVGVVGFVLLIAVVGGVISLLSRR